MHFGTWEIILIIVALLLLFGPSRLPNLGASIGSAIRNFKKGFAEEEPKSLAGGDSSTAPTSAEKKAAAPVEKS